MKEIKYNKEVLQVIKNLSSSLIKEFVIRKSINDSESLSIKVNEKSLGIFVDFTTPIDSFNFESDALGFSEGVYSEFHKFFSLLDEPVLKQDANKLILKENNQTIKFSPSNPEIIKNEFKGAKNLPEASVSLPITSDQFKYIKKMINMLDSNNVHFKGKGKNLEIGIVNNVNENGTTMSFELENEIVGGEVDILLNTLIFKNAPELNYVVNIIDKANIFQFLSVNENFTLNLYTGTRSV